MEKRQEVSGRPRRDLRTKSCSAVSGTENARQIFLQSAVGVGAKSEVRKWKCWWNRGRDSGLPDLPVRMLIIPVVRPCGRSWRARGRSSVATVIQVQIETSPRWNWFRSAVTLPHDKSWRERSLRALTKGRSASGVFHAAGLPNSKCGRKISRFFFFPYRHTSCIKKPEL